MRYVITTALVFLLCINSYAAQQTSPSAANKEENGQNGETLKMLASLVKLQRDIEQQIAAKIEKMEGSSSEAEKTSLGRELTRFDQQLSETRNDFERIATGVEIALFAEKKPETFSWKQEITTLLEPAVKELKRLTIRTRNKTRLKDIIQRYDALVPVAQDAVQQLLALLTISDDPEIRKRVKLLLPEWQSVERRILNKLELTELELSRLEADETRLSETLSDSTRDFFRARGVYLLGAVLAFFLVVLIGTVVYRFLFALVPGSGKAKLPLYIRIFDLSFRFLTVFFAVLSSFFILYLAEDWFLLSMAIIFFLGLGWTVRQGVSKMWHQARLILNVGSIREGERVILHGVPWKLERIHVFCWLYNPSLAIRLRIPIEEMVGKVSRASKPEEPWFPCKKGDWVVLGDTSRAKVVHLSHEAVELVERGGKRITYQTQDFLALSPVNLSRNFRLRIPFGITYSLQAQATSAIPEIMRFFIEEKLKEKGYAKKCLHLSVEFQQANSSSLDLLIIADFKGELAEIYTRLERYIQQCCVEVCTENEWEIPFPQLTFHWPEKEASL
ncbi:MAG: mechanosensitive ion channel family protein [Thermodesulfobacteriota bacterium]|nr:mechanosensitive ion channel family protein [Thermodesulfobacteriota bacterium]